MNIPITPAMWTDVTKELALKSHSTIATASVLSASPAEEVQSVFDSVVGLGELFLVIGLVLVLYGGFGWAVYSKGSENAGKGKFLFFSGIVFMVIGFDFNGFLEVVKYVLE